MNILADENVEMSMIDWLRQTGHDVIWAAELYPSNPDPAVLEIARQTSRILLTRDLDFGELIYREDRAATGVILVRIRAKKQWQFCRVGAAERNPPRIAKFSSRFGGFRSVAPTLTDPQAPGHFLVVSNHQVRVRALNTP